MTPLVCTLISAENVFRVVASAGLMTADTTHEKLRASRKVKLGAATSSLVGKGGSGQKSADVSASFRVPPDVGLAPSAAWRDLPLHRSAP